MKEWIRECLSKSGACAVGFAAAGSVEEGEWSLFEDWLRRGDNAGMEYMHNYPGLRRDPRMLEDGTRSVISLAFNYKPETWRDDSHGMIASYAYGKDYHKVIRKLLKEPLRVIGERFPDAQFRVCVDSAPVLERYWALKSGVGYRGDNGCVIVPGFGSMVFLAEVLTNLEIEPDAPLEMDCGHCGACRRTCPGNALTDTIDCRRCLSYLTIEHRGEISDPEGRAVMETRAGQQTIFGCDRCLRVCPHNRTAPPTEIEAFRPLPQVLELTRSRLDELRAQGEEAFRAHFAGSPILRGFRGTSGLRPQHGVEAES